MKIFTIALALLLPGFASVQEPRKPNIVLILADDLGAECLGSYGCTSYKTPNLDALARSGLRFENCYCTPLCSPSRVQLMTGRYGFRTGWTQLIESDGDEYFDPKKEKTFGSMLQAAGYATGIAGKWQLCHFDKHPDHLRECGFEEHCMWTWQWDGKRSSRYWDPSIWQNGKLLSGTDGKFGPDLFSDFACDYIRRHKDQPFFFYYPMALVHIPFTSTPDSKDRKAKDQKVFPDMIAYMDKMVGKVMATLDECKLRENTIVIFTGDNGTTKGVPTQVGDRTVIGGKGTMLDTGSHVPLIVSWPGTTPAGKTLDHMVDFSDVVPTLCELTGAKLPGATIDGRSFAEQIRGRTGTPRDWIFVQLGKKRFVRDQRWKLHQDRQLFDLKEDPEEKAPVATDSAEAAAARKRLEEALAKLR